MCWVREKAFDMLRLWRISRCASSSLSSSSSSSSSLSKIIMTIMICVWLMCQFLFSPCSPSSWSWWPWCWWSSIMILTTVTIKIMIRSLWSFHWSGPREPYVSLGGTNWHARNACYRCLLRLYYWGQSWQKWAENKTRQSISSANSAFLKIALE